jgi:hypothetical protein
MNNLPNYHLISIKYMGASNTRGSRVKIESLRFPNDSVTVSYSYQYGNILDQSIEFLKDQGFKLKGFGYDEKKGTYILMSETFEPIKELKASAKQLSERQKGWNKDHYNYNKAEVWEKLPTKRKIPARNIKRK